MKQFFLLVAAVLGFASPQLAVAVPAKTTFFVYAKIQDTVPPLERGTKYEDPLDAALRAAKLGEVTGGGSMLTKEKTIEWIGVDIELVNLTDALVLTKKKLRELGAPKGSMLEFERDGKQFSIPIHDE